MGLFPLSKFVFSATLRMMDHIAPQTYQKPVFDISTLT